MQLMANSVEAAYRDLVTSDVLRAVCEQVHFQRGDVLRSKGQHYRSMYLVTDGSVAIELDGDDGRPRTVISGPGTPVGEIGFLQGCVATATVTADSAVGALMMDNRALAQLSRDAPALAADLLRHLAETAQERTSYNLTHHPSVNLNPNTHAIDVYLCRGEEMLEKAKRLRYQVYCEELHRNSSHADHERKTLSDDLDTFGNTFIAVEGDEVIGTLRANVSSEGPLGVLEELYGMKASPFHPSATGICTKFIVKKAKRGSPAATKLISAVVRFGLQNSIKECYGDCIPSLLHYYKALGFVVSGPKFFHEENGPSLPLRLDVVKHGEKLSQDRGVRDDFKLYVKAQAIRLFDKIRDRGAKLLQPT